MGKEAHTWISNMFNLALQYGTPLHKGRDINNMKLIYGKTIGCIMEINTSAWVEKWYEA